MCHKSQWLTIHCNVPIKQDSTLEQNRNILNTHKRLALCNIIVISEIAVSFSSGIFIQ